MKGLRYGFWSQNTLISIVLFSKRTNLTLRKALIFPMQLDFSYLLSNKIPRVVYYVCPNVVLIQEGTKSSQVLTRSEQLSSCTKKVNLLFHFLPFHRVAQNEKKTIYARCAFTAFTAQRKHLNNWHFNIRCLYLPGFKQMEV